MYYIVHKDSPRASSTLLGQRRLAEVSSSDNEQPRGWNIIRTLMVESQYAYIALQDSDRSSPIALFSRWLDTWHCTWATLMLALGNAVENIVVKRSSEIHQQVSGPFAMKLERRTPHARRYDEGARSSSAGEGWEIAFPPNCRGGTLSEPRYISWVFFNQHIRL